VKRPLIQVRPKAAARRHHSAVGEAKERPVINLERLAAAPTHAWPFRRFSATGVISRERLAEVARDFPPVDQAGLFALSDLRYGPAFARLIEDLRRPEFTALMERKLDVDLADRPMMITVRGRCALRDGRAHTDSEDKIATGLLYLNGPEWRDNGGRLRLLASGDVEDVLEEVAPEGGVLLAFRRSDRSWHGHRPFAGERRYVMFNWLRSGPTLAKNLARHKLSSAFKRVGAVHGR
jgi:hypothetical protein